MGADWTIAIELLQRAAESDDGGINNIAFLFLTLGFLFYGFIYIRYRNVDKRHGYEKDTRAEMTNVTANDAFVQSMRGLTNAKMRGANHTVVRGARRSWF